MKSVEVLEVDKAGDLFINHEVRRKHGWTFEQFLEAYKRNKHIEILKRGAQSESVNA